MNEETLRGIMDTFMDALKEEHSYQSILYYLNIVQGTEEEYSFDHYFLYTLLETVLIQSSTVFK